MNFTNVKINTNNILQSYIFYFTFNIVDNFLILYFKYR